MKPTPQCSNSACLERQREYILAKPAKDAADADATAAARAKMEAEAEEFPIHGDNEWNISVVDDSGVAGKDVGSLDTLPEGLTHELPSADGYSQLPASEETSNHQLDDLDQLRKQFEALIAQNS
ncbi:hypothetical protein ACH5RR_015188 [Cinchona calisaya]|uniref:Uncharacterized protein n=1 Tax=Cinchona calisaya TaxID=153742 RepID=A0ABD2ZSE7_9GENT